MRQSNQPENCHVVFVKSVQFRTSTSSAGASSFPEMINDSFTPSASSSVVPSAHQSAIDGAKAKPSTSLSTKPLAPPTRSLVELPTCPVCLERMDETTGLLTILCQHVFHCACLEKWRGSGCPVCRYTQSSGVSSLANDGSIIHNGINNNNSTTVNINNNDSGALPENECRVCGALSNLWICLICGNTGCGRYDEAHAFAHYEATGHSYAMDIATQAVWDYAGDGYVHRLIQNKADGKLVDLPAAFSGTSPNINQHNTNNPNSAYTTSLPADSVPREKIDNMATEYAYLLTSQLDSQRRYFEEQLERAVTKAATAAASAEKAAASLASLTGQMERLQSQHDATVASAAALEASAERQTRRAEKAEGLARSLRREWAEEKTVGESLMAKVKFLDGRVVELEGEREGLREKVAELEEMNRDLGFFISGGERLKALGGGGAGGAGSGEGGGGAGSGTGGGGGDGVDGSEGSKGSGIAIERREIVDGRVEIPVSSSSNSKESGAGAGKKNSKNTGKKKKR